jgi:hypothetical protein
VDGVVGAARVGVFHFGRFVLFSFYLPHAPSSLVLDNIWQGSSEIWRGAQWVCGRYSPGVFVDSAGFLLFF